MLFLTTIERPLSAVKIGLPNIRTRLIDAVREGPLLADYRLLN